MALAVRSKVVYQEESWEKYSRDVMPLWVLHWKEVGLSHAAVPLDPDMDRYQAFADRGELHIVTMRTMPDDRLIGYIVSIVTGHLHYKSTLHSHTDLFFVLPEYRKGMAGVRLFREAERHLKARGVVKIQSGCKVHGGLDMTRLFERLGYALTDKLFSKLL